jgi:hypothetical protein
VLLRELFLKENQAGPHPTSGIKLGRAFNHPEHFIIFYGLSGITEAIEHLTEVVAQPKQLRFKWDGNPQIYWGREKKNGPLILAGHNGWSKGGRGTGTTIDDFTSPKAIENFIINKSGNPKTPAEVAERQRFASEFSGLYHIFDAATPKDFVGFVYADALFLPNTKPAPDENGIYTMRPNPHSKTEYHVDSNAEKQGPLKLASRIPGAHAMIVAHGIFKSFGAPDDEQIPEDDFSKFNTTPGLIVVSPIYNDSTPQVDMTEIKEVQKVGGYIAQHGNNIQNFVTHIPTGDRQTFFYRFLNIHNSANDFDSITPQMLYDWMASPKDPKNPDSPPMVSANKQLHIKNTDLKFNALAPMFHLMKIMRRARHAINDSLNSMHKLECYATNPEGFVRYAGGDKQHGHIKLQNAGWKD